MVCKDIIDVDGKMTKDLALSIHGNQLNKSHYLNTEEFLSAIEEKLKVDWAKAVESMSLSKI